MASRILFEIEGSGTAKLEEARELMRLFPGCKFAPYHREGVWAWGARAIAEDEDIGVVRQSLKPLVVKFNETHPDLRMTFWVGFAN